MSKQVINVGTAPNDNSGDTLRASMQKINANFTELYANTDAGVVHPSNLTANLANYTNTAVLTSLLPVSSVNNALYLASVPAASYQLNSTLSANVATYLPTYTGILNASSIAVTGGATIGGAMTVSGNLTVTGNLTFAGTTTFVNSTVITTTDKNIILSNGAASSLLTDGTGIVAATYANLVYKNSASSWQSNVNITPAANNLGLGNTTSIWNVYSNTLNARVVLVSNTINPTTNNYTLGNTTALWNSYSNNIWAVSANISGTINALSTNITSNLNISTGAFIANSTGAYHSGIVNSASYTIGSALSANSLGIYHTGTVNSSSYSIGATMVANTIGITHGGFINVASANVTTNNLTLGTSIIGANGYTYLPNGLKLNWGWVLADRTTYGDITFSSAFTTNAFVITATSNNGVDTYQAGVISWTKTGASIRTANNASTNVFWQAIGF